MRFLQLGNWELHEKFKIGDYSDLMIWWDREMGRHSLHPTLHLITPKSQTTPHLKYNFSNYTHPFLFETSNCTSTFFPAHLPHSTPSPANPSLSPLGLHLRRLHLQRIHPIVNWHGKHGWYLVQCHTCCLITPNPFSSFSNPSSSSYNHLWDFGV